MSKATHRDMLRAFAIGDTDTARSLNDTIPDSERQDFHDLVSAFFAVLLEYEFQGKLNRDNIAAFVKELAHDYRDAPQPINTLAVEGTIRGAFGEERLLEDISAAEVLSAQFQVIGKIVAQHAEVSNGIDGHLDKAEQVVATWNNA